MKEADSKEINLLLQILNENKIKIDEINGKLQERRDQIIKDENRFVIVNDEIETGKAKLIAVENGQNEAQQQLFALKTQKEKADADRKLFAEKLQTANDNISRIQSEIDSIMNRDDGFMTQVANLEKQRDEKLTVKNELAAVIEAEIGKCLKQKQALQDLTDTLELSRNELFDLAGELANSKNDLVYKTQEIADNEQSIANLLKAKADLENEKDSLTVQIADLKGRLDENQEYINRKQQNFDDLEQKAAQITAAISNAIEDEVKSRMQLNSSQSRLKVLKELAENRDGFYPGACLAESKKTKSARRQKHHRHRCRYD